MLHCPYVHNNSNTKVQAQLPKGFSVWGAIFVHPGGTCLPQEIIDFPVTRVLHGSLPLWATEPIEHGATQNIKFLWKCDVSTYPYLLRNSKFELDFPCSSLLNTCVQPVLRCFTLAILYDSEMIRDWCFVFVCYDPVRRVKERKRMIHCKT